LTKTAIAQIVLSIETGIRGGSLSLLRNGVEIDGWKGAENVSKAEDILEQTAKLFTRSGVPKENVSLITFSSGPGSATGLRIGQAIARGLSKAINCSIKTVPVFDALATEAAVAANNENFATAIPFGKNMIYWRLYIAGSNRKCLNTELELSSPQIFFNEIKNKKNLSLIIHEYLYDYLNMSLLEADILNLEIIKVKNLAQLIGANS
jgi:tRNA threonylcarbamoyl adenosine modification protein YeaZ